MAVWHMEAVGDIVALAGEGAVARPFPPRRLEEDADV